MIYFPILKENNEDIMWSALCSANMKGIIEF